MFIQILLKKENILYYKKFLSLSVYSICLLLSICEHANSKRDRWVYSAIHYTFMIGINIINEIKRIRKQ